MCCAHIDGCCVVCRRDGPAADQCSVYGAALCFVWASGGGQPASSVPQSSLQVDVEPWSPRVSDATNGAIACLPCRDFQQTAAVSALS